MLAHAHDGANVGSTGRRHEIGNSTSEASKQARGEFLLFPHDVRGGKHYSSFFGQEVRPGQDQVLCLLFKEHLESIIVNISGKNKFLSSHSFIYFVLSCPICYMIIILPNLS